MAFQNVKLQSEMGEGVPNDARDGIPFFGGEGGVVGEGRDVALTGAFAPIGRREFHHPAKQALFGASAHQDRPVRAFDPENCAVPPRFLRLRPARGQAFRDILAAAMGGPGAENAFRASGNA